MAKKSAGAASGSGDDQLSLEFDSDIDIAAQEAAANDILDIRDAFERLSVYERAALAERIVRADLAELLGEAIDIEDTLARFLVSAIDSSRTDDGDCALCGKSVWDVEPMVEQTIWTGEARNGSQLRSDTGRIAHEDCVKRAREGGDPAESPIW